MNTAQLLRAVNYCRVMKRDGLGVCLGKCTVYVKKRKGSNEIFFTE